MKGLPLNLLSAGWLVALSLISQPTWAADAYTLEDLQALAESQSWLELAEHLGDVPPSQRDQSWSQIAEQTTLGILETSLKQEAIIDGFLIGETLVTSYPSLKDSPEVMSLRAEIGLQAHEQCLQESFYDTSYCRESLTTLVQGDPQNLDLAFAAGKLVRLHANHWVAIPYFRQALATPSDSRPCGDEDIALALVSGLSLPASSTEIIDDSLAIAGGSCWETLKSVLLTELQADNPYFRENTCPLLQSKQALDESTQALCQL
ncbi:MAG: hypothetical protein HC921_08035 [Synechococcaceae cyanobacterium SM2_3_1]|nr:hypothetical protein [Synechococcaceae cyanobacterium SM2_3_1]